MNAFVAEAIGALREQDIYALLVKGQGIAQCYEKPLWRPSGDIDLFLSKDNYGKAVSFFKNRYSNYKDGGRYSQEYAFYTDQWMIEVHGTLRTCLSSRIDKVVDTVQKSVFYGGNVRSWENNGTLVFLPAPTEDVFLVFTHFIKHFYKEGMTLRQVCDWCRLLYTFRDSLYYGTLEQRIKSAGLMNEWNAFAAFAVEYLGMPIEAIPLYSKAEKWSRKAEKIVDFILKGGEWGKWKDTYRVGRIFPMSTLKYFPGIILNVKWLKIKERV
jgi:hypothetical protein